MSATRSQCHLQGTDFTGALACDGHFAEQTALTAVSIQCEESCAIAAMMYGCNDSFSFMA